MCPRPILETARALRELSSEATLRVVATDAAFEKDLPAFCDAAGHEFLGVERMGPAVWVGRLRKRRIAR
jgi:tRNA 2-thiouridine synthesizing protein A